MKNKIMEKLCDYCKKNFDYYPSTHKNRKFCSNDCKFKYFKKHKISAFYNPKLKKIICSKGGKIGGHNAQKTLKRLKKGFYNLETGRKGGKIGGKAGGKITSEFSRKNKRGFFDIKFQRENNKKVQKTLKRLKKGLYDPKIREMGRAEYKRRKLGFYDPKRKYSICSKGGKIGGRIGANIVRHRKRIKLVNCYFDSYKEAELGLCIYYQIERLIEGENFQVKVGNKTHDFLIKKCKLFLEYHKVLSFLNPKETDKNYYSTRRNNLNKNGYKDYNLVVIK